jgi:hypothetical protein
MVVARIVIALLPRPRAEAVILPACAALQWHCTRLNPPDTLSVKSVLQCGADHLHLLVAYESGSIDGKADSTVE